MAFRISGTDPDFYKEYECVDKIYDEFDAYNDTFEAGAREEVGVGRVRVHREGVGLQSKVANVSAGAKFSVRDLEAEAKVGAELSSISVSTDPCEVEWGPVTINVPPCSSEVTALSASAGVKADSSGVRAMAKAEVLSVSASAGPLKGKIGLGFDTGFGVGVEGLNARVLGTGMRVGGGRVSVSALNSEVECCVS